MSDRAGWAQDKEAPRYHRIAGLTGEDLERLRRDTCRSFHDLMDAAMLVNSYKYGDIHKAYPDRVDALASLKNRIERYEQDGNVRWLVDAANFAMLEFALPRHAGAHLGPDESIGRVVPGVGEFTEVSNEDLNAPVIARRQSARSGD